MKRRIRYGYTGHKDSVLFEEATAVHNKMIIEPALTYFTGLQGELMLLGAAITKFEDSFTAEKTEHNLAVRNVDRQALIDLLVYIALEVTKVSKGDEVKLTASGYKLVALPVRHSGTPIGVPQNVRVRSTGLNGQVKLRCNAVPYALNYQMEYNLDPAIDNWVRLPPLSNSQKGIISGLPRKVEVAFRIRAIGTNGPGNWSDIVLLIIT